jgi:hypothetical protein
MKATVERWDTLQALWNLVGNIGNTPSLTQN